VKSSERREERERAEATLAIVDAALEAGHPIGERDDRERELGQIALTLRAGAPQPSAGFAADLEERVWAGFEEDRPEGSASSDRRERSSRRPAKRWLRPLDRTAAGAVAAAAVALVVAGGLLSAGGNGTREGTVPQFSGGGSAAPRTAPEEGLEPYNGESDVQDRALSDDAAAPEEGGSLPGFAPSQAQRRIERTASLTLAAPEDRIDAISKDIVAATARHRGYLVSSSTFSGEDEAAGGSFDLRVPVEELRATLSELAALGTVRAQSQTGEDLTEPVATAADRLDGARADRRGLLRRLERAETDRQARALRRQLDLVSGEIRGLRGQLEALEERTDYARVSVTLTDESSSGATGTPSSTESALDDAVGSLLAAFNFSLRALGVLVPLAVAGGLAWLAFAAVRRRRREAVLG
jgi:hypothetical protein